MTDLKLVTEQDLMLVHQKLDIIQKQVSIIAGKKIDNEKPKMINARQVTKQLGISHGTWKKHEPELVKAGILHPNRLGRLIKYNSQEIDRIVSENLIHKYQHKQPPRY